MFLLLFLSLWRHATPLMNLLATLYRPKGHVSLSPERRAAFVDVANLALFYSSFQDTSSRLWWKTKGERKSIWNKEKNNSPFMAFFLPLIQTCSARIPSPLSCFQDLVMFYLKMSKYILTHSNEWPWRPTWNNNKWLIPRVLYWPIVLSYSRGLYWNRRDRIWQALRPNDYMRSDHWAAFFEEWCQHSHSTWQPPVTKLETLCLWRKMFYCLELWMLGVRFDHVIVWMRCRYILRALKFGNLGSEIGDHLVQPTDPTCLTKSSWSGFGQIWL